MSDPETFISRWLRRKREAATEDAQQKQADAGEAKVTASDRETKSASSELAAPAPEFDISSLPPIESIDAGTDIAAFMQPGVPAALRHAALRRAWSTDPAIRNFMELTENFWDAAGPGGVPGFGNLDPNLDVKRLVSEVFGETSDSESSKESRQQQISSSNSDNRRRDILGSAALPPANTDLSQRTENIATQKESPESVPVKKIARRHGGAMPQ